MGEVEVIKARTFKDDIIKLLPWVGISGICNLIAGIDRDRLGVGPDRIVPATAGELEKVQSGGRSRVTATERVLCTLPDGSPSTSFNPSCDGKYVAFGVTGFSDAKRGPAICKVDLKSGQLSEVCRLPEPPGYGGHVQWSRTNPHLISFAGGRGPTKDVAGPTPIATAPEDYCGRGQRLWVVDIREGIPRNAYLAEEGELVTHESWWVNDQMLFCGGKTPAAR